MFLDQERVGRIGCGAGFGRDRPVDCAILPELVDWAGTERPTAY
jgi:hypothetical protein